MKLGVECGKLPSYWHNMYVETDNLSRYLVIIRMG